MNTVHVLSVPAVNTQQKAFGYASDVPLPWFVLTIHIRISDSNSFNPRIQNSFPHEAW